MPSSFITRCSERTAETCRKVDGNQKPDYHFFGLLLILEQLSFPLILPLGEHIVKPRLFFLPLVEIGWEMMTNLHALLSVGFGRRGPPFEGKAGRLRTVLTVVLLTSFSDHMVARSSSFFFLQVSLLERRSFKYARRSPRIPLSFLAERKVRLGDEEKSYETRSLEWPASRPSAYGASERSSNS